MPILDKIYTEIKEACLMGDFNIKFINYDSHNTTFQFLDSIWSNQRKYSKLTCTKI